LRMDLVLRKSKNQPYKKSGLSLTRKAAHIVYLFCSRVTFSTTTAFSEPVTKLELAPVSIVKASITTVVKASPPTA